LKIVKQMDIPTSNHHIGSTERVFVAHVNDLNGLFGSLFHGIFFSFDVFIQ